MQGPHSRLMRETLLGQYRDVGHRHVGANSCGALQAFLHGYSENPLPYPETRRGYAVG